MNTLQRYTSINLPKFCFIPMLKNVYSDYSQEDHIPKLPKQKIEFTDQSWEESKRYLFAIDLFNNGYYWEVHEVLETLWLEIGKHSPIGIFIRGLIQISVALLKKKESNQIGVQRLANKSLSKLKSQEGIYLGIDIIDLIEQFHLYIEDKHSAPIIVLKFDLGTFPN